MKKLLLLSFLLAAFSFSGFAQETESLESLKAMKAEKEAVIAGVQAEVADIEKRILEFPGWTTGLGVLFGLDFGGQQNWFAVANPDLESQKFGIGLTAFANYNASKYYLRNGLGVNWGRTLTTIGDTKQPVAEIGTVDLISSAGYYIYKNLLAASGRLRWSTVLFDLSPGSVTASAGLSLTPMKNLEFWVHPLGYQYNYPGDEFTSTTGASFGGSYSGTIYKNIKWSSTLEGFYSYQEDETTAIDGNDLHNWTWTNGFIIDNLWSGIGVGFNIALRQNRQLAKFAGIEDPADWNTLQSLYNLGLSYSISN